MDASVLVAVNGSTGSLGPASGISFSRHPLSAENTTQDGGLGGEGMGGSPYGAETFGGSGGQSNAPNIGITQQQQQQQHGKVVPGRKSQNLSSGAPLGGGGVAISAGSFEAANNGGTDSRFLPVLGRGR